MCYRILSNLCLKSSHFLSAPPLLTEAGQGSPQTCKNRIQLGKAHLELDTHQLCIYTYHYPFLDIKLYTLHGYDLPGTVCAISRNEVIGEMGNVRRQRACVKVDSDHIQQIDGNRNRPVEWP